MLTYTFGDAAEILARIHAGTEAAFLAAAIAAVFFCFAARRMGRKLWIWGPLVAVLAFAGFRTVTAYSASRAQFVGLRVAAEAATLEFPGRRIPVIIPATSIASVTFDFPGRSAQSCYLRFNLLSGESYRSATIAGQTCKALRGDVMRQMALPRTSMPKQQ